MKHQNDISSPSGNIFDERYYSINKRYLQFIGQWPYQYHTERNIRFWLFMFLACSGLGPQLRSMVVTWGKLDAFAACFTPILANIGCLVLLINSQCHTKQMKKILDQTIRNWECMRDMPQLKILQDHGETGRLFTIMYSFVCYSAMCGWILTPLLPKILDVVAPLNHSRNRIDMFPTDYGLDADEFFWPIFFHLGGGLVLVLSILVTIDSFYMSLAQHACAMFEILRYDVENALQQDDINTAVELEPDYHADAVYYEIVSCMKRHKSLIEYVHALESTCEWSLFCIVGISVVALSFTGYQTVAKGTPKEDVLRMGLFSFAQTFHLYCISLPSHWISSESSFLPASVYSCKWYMMSLRSRKLLILFMRAGFEPCSITAGKIYVLSIENFCSVLQTSLSYLTMLTSFQ